MPREGESPGRGVRATSGGGGHGGAQGCPRAGAGGQRRSTGGLRGRLQHVGDLRVSPHGDGPRLARTGRLTEGTRLPPTGARGRARDRNRGRPTKAPASRAMDQARGWEPAGRRPRLPRARPRAHGGARHPLAPAGTRSGAGGPETPPPGAAAQAASAGSGVPPPPSAHAGAARRRHSGIPAPSDASRPRSAAAGCARGRREAAAAAAFHCLWRRGPAPPTPLPPPGPAPRLTSPAPSAGRRRVHSARPALGGPGEPGRSPPRHGRGQRPSCARPAARSRSPPRPEGECRCLRETRAHTASSGST